MSYQGLAAPTTLFADLAQIGWTPPTIAPPPHDAIDWSTPDETTGESFTRRDYPVVGAVAQPPRGSGTEGRWTPVERAAFLAALTGVLRAHSGAVAIDDPGSLVADALLPPPPAPSPPSSRTLKAVVPGPADATSRTIDPVGLAAPTESGPILVTAALKPSLAPGIEDALVALGLEAVFDNHDRVRTQRYRGATYETTVSELRVAVVTDPDRHEAVRTILQDAGLAPTATPIDPALVEQQAPEVAVETTSAIEHVSTATDLGDGADLITHDPGHARVVLLIDPGTLDATSGVIRSLGLADTRITRSTRSVISTYRASRYQRELVAERVEAWVPEMHARLVATHLADAARLDIDDADRVWIDAPVGSATVVAPRTEIASGPVAPASPTTWALGRPSPIAPGTSLASRLGSRTAIIGPTH